MTTKPSLEKLASSQFGLVTEAQLTKAGYTRAAIRWAVQDQRLVKVHTGVYRLPGAEQTWNQRAMAAVLLQGPGAVLSHATAALLWRITGFKDREPIHVMPPRTVNTALPKGVVRHSSGRPFAVHWHGQLPITTLARTLVDLAPSLDEEALEIAMDSAQYRRPFLEQDLEEEIGPKKNGRRGRGGQRIIDLLDLRGGVATESPLETKVRRVLRRTKLPPPNLQFDVFEDGRFIIRADFAWPRERVVLHADGFTFHGPRKQFDRDAEQRSALSGFDWASIIVTDRTLLTGEWLRSLERALSLRGEQRRLL